MKETLKQKTLRKTQEKKSKDRAWSLAVKRNSGVSVDGKYFRCEITDQYLPENQLCSHHIISKASRPSLRWDEDNGLCVSTKIHIKIHGDANWYESVYKPHMKKITKERPMAFFLGKFI